MKFQAFQSLQSLGLAASTYTFNRSNLPNHLILALLIFLIMPSALIWSVAAAMQLASGRVILRALMERIHNRENCVELSENLRAYYVTSAS